MKQAVYEENHSAELDRQREELIGRLSSDPAVLRMLDEREIPYTVIESNPFRIANWLKEFSVCGGCRGLSECRRPQKGYSASLKYDGLLQDSIRACRYEETRRKDHRHLQNYLICDLSEEMKTVSFEEIDLSSETAQYARSLKHCIMACTEKKGIYLYGSMGSGKTYLAACAANYMARRGHKTAFVHYPSFCERTAAALRTGEYKTETERMSFADMLVIDDIGAEEVTERTRNILLSVLDVRMQNRRMTWFTSNDNFESLEEHFTVTSKGEDRMAAMRIMERIRALCETERMIGKNRRNLSDTL